MRFAETETVELKEKLNDNFIKVVDSFLNTINGVLYIGVKDDGEIIGISDTDKTLREIADIVTTQILPNPQELIEIGTKYIDGKTVIEVRVNKGNALYYIKKYGRSATGCYIRVGSTSRSMTEEQIDQTQMKYFNAKSNIVDCEAREQDLSFDYLKMLYKSKGLTLTEEAFIKNLKLKTKNGKFNIQAQLLADINDYSIKIVRFDGTTKASNMIVRNEYGYKCLIVAMKEAFDYCVDIVNETQTEFVNGIREDIKLFDADAFREAWYNACLHNDWIDGTPPAIYLFSDHLEIISTGGLPYNLTKADFFGGVSRPVNELLARIFIQLGLIEQTGHGVLLIVDKYGKEAFGFLDHFLRVSLPYSRLLKVDHKVDHKVDNIILLSHTQHKVIELLRTKPDLTGKEISVELSLSIQAVKKNMQKLKELGYIRRVGSNKTGHWEVIE